MPLEYSGKAEACGEPAVVATPHSLLTSADSALLLFSRNPTKALVVPLVGRTAEARERYTRKLGLMIGRACLFARLSSGHYRFVLYDRAADIDDGEDDSGSDPATLPDAKTPQAKGKRGAK